MLDSGLKPQPDNQNTQEEKPKKKKYQQKINRNKAKIIKNSLTTLNLFV